MNDRELEAVVAGLPAEVMDGLVGDMADAIVAMLLDQQATESNESDDAEGSDLRPV